MISFKTPAFWIDASTRRSSVEGIVAPMGAYKIGVRASSWPGGVGQLAQLACFSGGGVMPV